MLDGKLMSADELPGMWPGEAAEPERLRELSRAEAREDVPITYVGTMPFMEGEETCDVLVDDVVALGEDSKWCVGSKFSIPLMGGSCRNAEPFSWPKEGMMVDGSMCSGSGAPTMSMGETVVGICMDIASGSVVTMSEGNRDIVGDM